MARIPKLPVINSATVLKKRQHLGLNQSDFWSLLGVTQSAGSRYENDREIPTPVKRLYYVVYLRGTPDDAAFSFLW